LVSADTGEAEQETFRTGSAAFMVAGVVITKTEATNIEPKITVFIATAPALRTKGVTFSICLKIY
jgi:hypothetical protein